MQFEDIMKLPWREAAELLLRDGPKNCTWMMVRDYIEKTYTQQQILDVNVFLWRTLDSMDLESDEADEVRDESECWWYAMDDIELFHKAIEPHLREDEKMS